MFINMMSLLPYLGLVICSYLHWEICATIILGLVEFSSISKESLTIKTQSLNSPYLCLLKHTCNGSCPNYSGVKNKLSAYAANTKKSRSELENNELNNKALS